MFDNLFMLLGPVGTAAIFFATVLVVGGAYSLGGNVPRSS